MTVVYIDRVFVLNMLVDYLLLMTTAALAGTPYRRKRFATLSACGGLYAAAAFYLPMLTCPLLRLLTGAALSMTAFLKERRPWRLTLLFFLLSGAMAGAVLAVGLAVGSPKALVQKVYYADISYEVLLGTAALFYVLIYVIFYQEARFEGGEKVDITVTIRGRCCRLRALRDNGNTLRDPIQGKPVLVVETSALASVLDNEEEEILRGKGSAAEKMVHLCGREKAFTLLPFKSIGETEGLLLAVRSDYLQIGKRTIPRALVALTDTTIGSGCQALWGGCEGEEVCVYVGDAASDPVAFSKADCIRSYFLHRGKRYAPSAAASGGRGCNAGSSDDRR